jgi:alpha-3'-ketoglucosidase
MLPAYCLIAVLSTLPAASEPNTLTDEERRDGWLLLFDGRSLAGWTTSSEQPSKTPVDRGSLNPHGCGGYMLVHEKTWENFELALDFKLSRGCNSGIFVRTFPLTPRPGKDVGFNGIEIALDDTTSAGYHDTGAIYDLVPPTENAMKPIGEWNHMLITCDRGKIAVELNGETVTRMDLDEWTAPNKRPDGTDHKFDIAYKNHPRRGYIGLQDHGSPCWFRNIKLRELK